MIQFIDINYSYPDTISVFKDFSFSITQGQKIGIMGANGSGKTTLFYLIMGLLKPDSGSVIVLGKERKSEEDFSGVRKKVGFLFQDPDDQLFSPTVEEDIAFGPLNLGKSISEAHGIVDAVSRQLGIAHLKKRISFKLSWGQKRLVSLAGLLAMFPEALLLDEPTASIDEDVVERIAGYLSASTQTLLIASHDEPFLKKICTDIYVLKNSALSKKIGKTNVRYGPK